MKTKTKNVEPNSSIPRTYFGKIPANRTNIKADYMIGSQSRCGVRSFSFSFLSLCFLISLVDAQISSENLDPTNSLVPYLTQTLHDVNKLPHRGFTIPASQSNHPRASQRSAASQSSIGRQLWRAGISAYEGEKDSPQDTSRWKSKVALKRIIEQIRSIEFKPPKQTVKPVIIVEPVVDPVRYSKEKLSNGVKTVEPNETSSHTEAKEVRQDSQEETEKKAIEPRLPYGLLTGRTLQLVDNLAQHPGRSDNPFALGEVLYHSGRLKEAAVFYQEALKRKRASTELPSGLSLRVEDSRMSSDKAGSDQDRAWILFQIGNCLRDDDPPTAKKMYRILIAEYSDSLWVDLAKAREGLIDWQQKDKPRTLIAAESQL